MRLRRPGFILLVAVAGCDDPPPAWHAEVRSETVTMDRLAEILADVLKERVDGCEVERAAKARLMVRLPDGRSLPLYLQALHAAEPKQRALHVERRLSWFVEQARGGG